MEGCFSNVEDSYDATWHNKLGFMCIPNEDKRVIYLSHDDGRGNGDWYMLPFMDEIGINFNFENPS